MTYKYIREDLPYLKYGDIIKIDNIIWAEKSFDWRGEEKIIVYLGGRSFSPASTRMTMYNFIEH